MIPRTEKTEADYKAELSPMQYSVLREAATEQAFTGAYWDSHEDGTYRCAACGAELFDSGAKFDSSCGWPSFTDPAARDHVTMHEDSSHLMRRTEVRCAGCHSHLGHVFPDGPGETGERFCINSAALNLDRRSPRAADIPDAFER